jgi:HEAT repeat protein
MRARRSSSALGPVAAVSAAVRKLAQAGRPEFIALLTRLLGDTDQNVRGATVEALTPSRQSVGYVTDALDVGDSARCRHGVGRRGSAPASCRRRLLARANDADPVCGRWRALGDAPPGVAVDALVAGTTDPDPGVRAQAALALAPQAADSTVRRRLESIARDDRSVEVRDAAIRSLSEGTRNFRQQEMKR